MGDYTKGGICLLIGFIMIMAGLYWVSKDFGRFTEAFILFMIGFIIMGIGGAFIRRGFWGRPGPW